MYKCKECGCIFEEPKKISLEMFYGVLSQFHNSYGETIDLCPECESNSIEEYDEDEEDMEENKDE